MKALFQSRHILQSKAVRAVVMVIAGLSLFAVSATSLAQTTISPALSYASFMYQRLGGVTLPISDPRLASMATMITAGNSLGAAQYVIANEPNFYNIVVRDMAAQMPTRTGTLPPNSPTTDYVADWIGVVRDNMDARNLVQGNFLYTANPSLVPNLPNNMVKDILTSNNHYAFLDSSGANLAAVLVNSGTQQLLNAAGTAAAVNPDPAGVITSLGFAQGNLNAGTNRAMVRNSILTFLCQDIANYADVGPDAPIGRDVDRYPAGSDTAYQTNCVMCHNRLDGMKPAFSLFDMDPNGNFIEHALYNPQPCTSTRVDYTGNGHNSCQGQFDPNNIAVKENRNSQVFPDGFQVTTPAWTNNATAGIYQNMFGWSGKTTGAGANQYGQMLASASSFSSCMAQTVFTTVCHRAPASDETAMVQALGSNFSGAWRYNMQTLFAQVAVLPNCLGSGQ